MFVYKDDRPEESTASGRAAQRSSTRSKAGLFAIWFLSLLFTLGLGLAPVLAQVPATPTGVTAIPGNSQVTIYWTASATATSYKLYRSTTSGGEGTTPYQSGITALGAQDTSLANGNTYYYKVAAVNASGASAQSTEVSGTPNTAPAAPTGLNASGVTGSVTLNWTAAAGATKYNVFRSTTSGNEGFIPYATNVTAVTYTDFGITNGSSYYYQVAAVGSNNSQGALSSEAGATPLGVTASIVMKPGNTALTVRWASVPGATGYNLYRGTIAGGEGTTAIQSVTTTSYTNTSLTNGTTYYYKIRATGLNSIGSLSAVEGSATPSALLPPAPTGFTAIPGDTTATLTWNPVSGATSYNIYRALNSGAESSVPTYTGVTSPYINTGLTDGQAYYYVVTAVNASGEGAWSPEISTVPQFSTARVNCGGSAYTDGASHTWLADKFYTGGSAIATGSTITGTADQPLFKFQRAGTSITYTIPVVNGTYNVSLNFAEVQGFTTGQRVFKVTANGPLVLNNFDIYAAAGAGNTAITKSFPVVVTGNTLTLVFTGITGNAAVASIQAALLDVGTAAADVPGPGWAVDVIPSDQCDSGGAGPSSSERVSLPSGVKENQPDSDLDVYNPAGPSVTYDRQYRSALAAAGYSSPGLPQGWADNYDLTITQSGTNYTLRYPNGGTEDWTTISGTVTPPAGTPYLVSVSSGSPVITFGDHSTYTFTADVGNPNFYRLSAIANLAGQSVTINRDSINGYRLTSVTNSLGTALLTFAYPTSTKMTVTDTSVSGDPRQITYNFGTVSGASTLLNVSKINDTSANYMWAYGYQLINGHPYLNSVQSASPTSATGLSGAARTAYDTHGYVAQLIDADGNTRSYQYNGTSTQVTVTDPIGNVTETWTQNFSGSKNVDTGTTDSAGQSDSTVYASANPYEPTSFYNKTAGNQPLTLAYDQHGNVTTQTNRRGVVSTLHQDPAFPLGQVDTVTVGTKTPTYIAYNTNGTVQSVQIPTPGTVGVSSWVQTSFTYTPAGNIATITKPAPNSTAGATVTYTYSYTADPSYDLSGNPGSCNGVAEGNGEPLVVTDPLGHSTHYRYDGHGNTTVFIDGVGNRTDYEYNAADQPTKVTYPATGQQGSQRANVVYTYQYVGGPLVTTKIYNESLVLVRTITETPGGEGEFKAQSGSVQQANVSLDSRFRFTQLIDGNGNASLKTQYNALGELTSILHAVGPAATIPMHDADGNPLQYITSRGITKTVTRYADDNRLHTITYSDSTPGVTYNYDSYNRVSSIVDGTGTTSYTYDDNDAILTTSTAYLKPTTGSYAPVTLSYTYYPDGSRASMTSPGTFSIRPSFQYWYDDAGRMTNVLQPWVATSISYSYDAADRMLTMNSALAHTTYTYNQRDFMTSLVNKSTTLGAPTMSSFTNMTYDAIGNRLGADISIPAVGLLSDLSGTVTYYYDDHDRMTDEIRTLSTGGGSTLYHNTFTSDAADNITAARGAAYSSNIGDQLINSGYGFDFDGNQTSTPLSGGGSSAITYDAENRPISIGSLLTQRYRGDGQRGWKADSSGTRTYYLYDGDTLVTEFQDSSGSLVPYNTFSSGVGGVAQRFFNVQSIIRNFTYDPDGSVVQHQIQAQSQYAVSSWIYDHAGGLEVYQSAGPASGDTRPPYSEGYLSQWGAYTDIEVRLAPAISLMPYMGGTYYDPATGRYVNRAADGVNPYAAFMSGDLDDFVEGFGMTALNLAAMSPGPIGKGADLASAYMSWKQGDRVGTLLSVAAAAGDSAAAGTKALRGLTNTTKAVGTAIAKGAKAAKNVRKRKEPTTFITYVFKNKDEVVYVGKTAGTGTPREVLNERLRGGRHGHYHPINGDKAEVIATQGNKLANAGAEDVWYNYYKLQGAKLRNDQNIGSTRSSRLGRTKDKIDAYAKDLKVP